jgi:3-oxoacyl-[acyl-carrier protein] reductase
VELADRVAIVTGAAGAVGAAVARRFSGEGARLLLADDDGDALERVRRDLRGGASAVAADPSAEPGARAIAAAALEQFGGIDVLVNAAGMAEEPPWDDAGAAAWDRRMRALAAAARCAEAVTPAMAARGRGRIVNVAASAGRYRSAWARPEGAAGRGVAAAAAGGGVLALTRELALELGPRGIAVNAVVPGWIETEASAREWERLAEGARRDILAEISLGRPGRPDEVAGAVLFLASDAASYVSGSAIDVNGGWWMS